MRLMGTKQTRESKHPKPKTPTFLLELPLQVKAGQAKRIRGHLVCVCGVGPIQRDLYSAFLAAHLDAENDLPPCARYKLPWEGAETRLRTDTRAYLPPQTREIGSVERTLRTPRCFSRGSLQSIDFICCSARS
jgi:hypothetical protein